MAFMNLYTEVCLAWVAFAAIVATLRQALGGYFTPLQYVMFRFFIECGLIHFMSALTTVALLDAMDDEQAAWQMSVALNLVGIVFYLPFHIRRRKRLGVPMPLVSKITTVGYVVLFFALLLALLEVWWKPSMGLLAAMYIFGMVSNTLIFIQFLGSFVVVREESTADSHDK